MSSYGAIDVPLHDEAEIPIARSFDPVLLNSNIRQLTRDQSYFFYLYFIND